MSNIRLQNAIKQSEWLPQLIKELFSDASSWIRSIIISVIMHFVKKHNYELRVGFLLSAIQVFNLFRAVPYALLYMLTYHAKFDVRNNLVYKSLRLLNKMDFYYGGKPYSTTEICLLERGNVRLKVRLTWWLDPRYKYVCWSFSLKPKHLYIVRKLQEIKLRLVK